MCKNSNVPPVSASSSDDGEITTTVTNEKMNVKKQNQAVQWKNKNDADSSQLPVWIEALPQSQQFVLLSGCMFLFFGVHNLLQEAIMKVPGFEGVMLSYMEVLG